MWLGVLETEDSVDNPRAHSISKDEAEDLKKNGRNFTRSSIRSEPIVPTLPQDTDAGDVEKPETVEEVLLEGKAVVPPAPLSDTPKPKPKPRRRKKK